MNAIINKIRNIFALCAAISMNFSQLPAQIHFFNQDNPATGIFENLKIGAVTSADIDNDGRSDIILSGLTGTGTTVSLVYINEGNNQFSPMSAANAPLKGLYHNGVAAGDIDGDGFPELLLFGWNPNDSSPKTFLYKNNGGGSLSVLNHNFPDIFAGFAKFGDVDGDGDSDLILSGITDRYDFFTGIYKNDGQGNLAIDDSYQLPQVGRSSGEWADLNGDGHLDLIIIGIDHRYNPVAKVFLNDGQGGLSEHTAAGLQGVYLGSISVADVNGDGAPDLFLTGVTKFRGKSSILYLNDGNANFIPSQESEFNGIWTSSALFADVNKDGAADLLMIGSDLNHQSILMLYINDGLGKYTKTAQSNLEGTIRGGLVFGDFDSDGDPDLIITGENYKYQAGTKYYTNISETLPDPPTVHLGADMAVCKNIADNYTLTAGDDSPAYTYRWSTGESTHSINVTTSGSYSVVVTNAYGQSAHDAVVVTFLEGPELDSIIVNAIDMTTFGFSAKGGNLNNYLWDFGDGSTSTEPNPIHSYATAGDHLVTLTAGNDCGSISRNHLIKGTNSNSSAYFSRFVSIYPNPATGTVVLQSERSKISSLRIFDIKGNPVIKESIAPSEMHRIDISRILPGTYVVEVVLTDGSVLKKQFNKME